MILGKKGRELVGKYISIRAQCLKVNVGLYFISVLLCSPECYSITTKLTKKISFDVNLQLYTFAEGFLPYSESHTSIQLTLKGNAASVVLLFEWNVNKNNNHKKASPDKVFVMLWLFLLIPVFQCTQYLHTLPKWTPNHLTDIESFNHFLMELMFTLFTQFYVGLCYDHDVHGWFLSILKNCQKHG